MGHSLQLFFGFARFLGIFANKRTVDFAVNSYAVNYPPKNEKNKGNQRVNGGKSIHSRPSPMRVVREYIGRAFAFAMRFRLFVAFQIEVMFQQHVLLPVFVNGQSNACENTHRQYRIQNFHALNLRCNGLNSTEGNHALL